MPRTCPSASGTVPMMSGLSTDDVGHREERRRAAAHLPAHRRPRSLILKYRSRPPPARARPPCCSSSRSSSWHAGCQRRTSRRSRRGRGTAPSCAA
jgi:hypothetical protein